MERYITKANKVIAHGQLEVVENSGLLTENGKMQKIYDSISQVGILEQAGVIDYGGKVITPSMIDRHNHLALDARLENHLIKMEDCEVERTIRAIKTMKDDLAAGVTTSRCLGDRLHIDVACKKAQKEGRVAGSKLVVSGISMRSSHGHGYVGTSHYGVEDFHRASRENIVRGVDPLKVFMTKVVNATPFIYHFLTLEEPRTVMGKAKSVNIVTACHCLGGQGLDDCLTAGIDCLEHVYYITQPQVERAKKKDRWVVYTPGYALDNQLLFEFPLHDREGSLREKGIIYKCLSGAIEGGLKFGTGTDELRQGLAQETCYIFGLGAKNRGVLAGVTINTTRIYGADKSTGSVAEGKATDFAVLEGNPLDDIEALKKAISVIQDGIIIF